MRIAHISDTHLGYRQYNLEEREKDIYEAFEDAIDKALEERAEILIHSGDLFDSSLPSIRTLYTFKNILRKIDGRIKIFAVLGEHDIPKRRDIYPHKLFDIQVLGLRGLEYLEYKDMLIAGISNMKGRLVENLKEELKRFEPIASNYKHSILIAHQAIKRYLPFEGQYELVDEDLPKNASYYALGHIHSRTISRFYDGLLAYAGSIDIIKKDDISSWKRDGKGLYIVDIEGDKIDFHKIDLDIRPQVGVDVEYDKLEALIDIINNIKHKKKPILHLRVNGNNIDRQYVMDYLNENLSDMLLDYRCTFVCGDYKEIDIRSNRIHIKELLEEYLGDKKLGELAYELYTALKDNDIDKAVEISKQYIGDNYDN